MISKMKIVEHVVFVGRLVVPVLFGVYYAWLKKQRTILEYVTEVLKIPTIPAILSLVASHVSLSTLSAFLITQAKIYPLLRPFKVRLRLRGPKDDEESSKSPPEPEKSVDIRVLYDPPPEETRGDIIIIHGLHGSLTKTWKQGKWPRSRNKATKISERCGEDGFESECGHVADRQQDACAKCADNNNRRKCDGCISDWFESAQFEEDEEEVCSEEMYSKCWPQDWLPADCPGARIISISYTTDPYLMRPVWIAKRIRSSMTQRSKEMMEYLLELGVGTRPIVWVAHSKGGLFVKQMLVDAWESGKSHLEGFYLSTKGIMFYSVPHRGSYLADINLPLMRKSVELAEVKKDCQEVLSLHNRFLKLYKEQIKAEVISFVETKLTFMSIAYVRIVSLESADPGIGEYCGVPLDHREICKPRSRKCFLYKTLISLINRVM